MLLAGLELKEVSAGKFGSFLTKVLIKAWMFQIIITTIFVFWPVGFSQPVLIYAGFKGVKFG